MPSVQILGSGCTIVQVDANGVGLEGVLNWRSNRQHVHRGFANESGQQFDAIFNVHHRGPFHHLPKIRWHECYVGTGVTYTHFALRDPSTTPSRSLGHRHQLLGSGNNPGATKSNAIVFIGNRIRENVTGMLVPSGASPDVFVYGRHVEGNIYGADLEGNGLFKDFGSHFENGNPNIAITAPAVCGGATPAPVEIVNCASSVEAITTGFYGVVGGSPIAFVLRKQQFVLEARRRPGRRHHHGRGAIGAEGHRRGALEYGADGRQRRHRGAGGGDANDDAAGSSVYQFRGFPYLDFTGQDARFRTITAALSGTDPNNGTLCFGLNCAHSLAEQGGSLMVASDPLFANFAPQFAGEVNVEGRCLGCAAAAEVAATQLQAQTSVLPG